MPLALGAALRVNLVDQLSRINRLIGALGLTDITIDAFVGNH